MEPLERHPLFKDMCSYLLAASGKIAARTFGPCLVIPGKCVALPSRAVKGFPARTRGGAVWSGAVASSRESAEIARSVGFPESVVDIVEQADGRRRMRGWESFMAMMGKRPGFDPGGDFRTEFAKFEEIERGLSHDLRREFGEFLAEDGWRPWFLLKFGFSLTHAGKLEFLSEAVFDFTGPFTPLSGAFGKEIRERLYGRSDGLYDFAAFKRGFNAMILGTFPKVDWRK